MTGNSLSNIRSALHDIDPGEWTDLNISPITIDEFATWFATFQKHSARKYEWAPSKAGVRITCLFGRKSGTKYGLETLRVGESMTIEVPDRSIHRVRQSASWLRRQTGQNFLVKVVPGGVEVTRLQDDRMENGRIIKADREREYRYPIHELEVDDYIGIPIKDQPRASALRAYCAYHGERLGRKFSITQERQGGRVIGHCIRRTE